MKIFMIGQKFYPKSYKNYKNPSFYVNRMPLRKTALEKVRRPPPHAIYGQSLGLTETFPFRLGRNLAKTMVWDPDFGKFSQIYLP